MDLKLRGLAELDPLSVTLPHGTEVVTRVERVIPGSGKRVSQGTIGRVVKSVGDEVDVLIVGMATLRYARRELTPRRVGQALYAVRREEAWSSLACCIVLDVRVGSHAWGLADVSSDEDRRGIFVHPLQWATGLVAPPDDLQRDDGSACYWSLPKAVRQALRADPNTLEALFVPGAVAMDPIGEWILEARDAFVSTEIYGSFGRYALGQLRRLEQGLRLAAHRSSVLEWLREDASLTLDGVAARLAAVSPRFVEDEVDRVEQAKRYVKQLYRSLHDQGLLPAADFASLAAFARDAGHDFELPRELRPKNAYNLLRLIVTATRWLRDGVPAFEATGALRERLLAIKRGEVPLAEVLSEAEDLAAALEEARDASPLPRRPDVAAADALLRRVGAEVARRHVQRAPGPLGVGAPVPRRSLGTSDCSGGLSPPSRDR